MTYSSLAQLKKHLRELLVKDPERCIKHFLSLVSEQARLHEDLAQLSARNNYLLHEKLAARMAGGDYDVGRAQVTLALVTYISGLEAEDGTIDTSLEMDWEKLERDTPGKYRLLATDSLGLRASAIVAVDTIILMRPSLMISLSPLLSSPKWSSYKAASLIWGVRRSRGRIAMIGKSLPIK